MGRYARKKGKASSCKGIGRRGGKTKTKTRDLDQIKKDILNNDQVVEIVRSDPDEDKSIERYCVHCARFFQTTNILDEHLKSKAHKKRVKKLKDWPDDC